MNNGTNNFQNFIGISSLQKALRNALIPTETTQQFIVKNGIIKEDELRGENRHILKDIMDGIYIEHSNASICSFSSDSKAECESFISWLNCKFTRFFVAINRTKLTGIITNDNFRFVPAPPTDKFDHIYTDEELYKAFNLPQKYIDIIESVIKERK